MRKLLILFIIFIPNTSFSNEKFVNYLKEGKKIIFMRHALAPGTADPKNFNINDCSTQRNLNEEGRSQSKRIGNFFKNKNIRIDKVLSSEWCRCKDTANIAFGNFQTFSALNSFYEARFAKNKSKQIKELKNWGFEESKNRRFGDEALSKWIIDDLKNGRIEELKNWRNER